MRILCGALLLLALAGCSSSPAPSSAPPPLTQAPAATAAVTAVTATVTPSQDKDTAFRQAIKSRFPGNLADAPLMARTICDDFRAGSTFTSELLHLQGLVPSLSAGDVGYLVDESTTTYCPGLNPH